MHIKCPTNILIHYTTEVRFQRRFKRCVLDDLTLQGIYCTRQTVQHIFIYFFKSLTKRVRACAQKEDRERTYQKKSVAGGMVCKLSGVQPSRQERSSWDSWSTEKWVSTVLKRKRSTISLERTREGHRQSDEYWNCFKGSLGETFERRGGVHNYGLFRAHRCIRAFSSA